MNNKHEFNTPNGFDATLYISTNSIYSDIRIIISSRIHSFTDFYICYSTGLPDRANFNSHLMVVSQQLDCNQTFEFSQALADAHDIFVQYENLDRFVNTNTQMAMERIKEAIKIRDFIFASTAIALINEPETIVESVLRMLDEFNAVDVFYEEAQFFYTTLLNRIISPRDNKAKLTLQDLVEKVVKDGQPLDTVSFAKQSENSTED